jgi:hypothetical protein
MLVKPLIRTIFYTCSPIPVVNNVYILEILFENNFFFIFKNKVYLYKRLKNNID